MTTVRARAVAALGVVVAALLAVAPGAAAAGAQPSGAGANGVVATPDALPARPVVAGSATTTSPAAAGVSTSLVSISPAVARPGDDVTVTVDVHNDTTAPVVRPTATLYLSRFRATTRLALDEWSGAEPTADVGDPMDSTETATPLAPGATWRATLRIDADEIGLASVWGPRGLAVTVTDGATVTVPPAGRLAVLRTFLLWYPVGDGNQSDAYAETVDPVHLGVAVPITGPATDLTLPGADAAVADATRDGSRLADVLDATRDEPSVTWAVDPALVATASRSSDASAAAWARAVCTGAADHDVHALPPFDPDVAAYAHAARRLPRVNAALTTADCSGTPGSTSSRGTDLAAAWTKKLLWPATGVPDAETLSTAATAGIDQAVVRPAADGPFTPARSTSLTPDAANATTVDGQDVTALVADQQLSDLLADSDASTTAQSTQALLAVTAVVARQNDGTSRDAATLLAALPRDWDPDPVRWRAQLDALRAVPWVDLVTLGAVAGAPASDVALQAPAARTVSHDELAPASVDSLSNARGSLSRFASITAQPATVRERNDPQLLVPVSVAFRADPAGRAHAVSAGITAAGSVVRSVTIVPGSDVNLISAGGDLPVTVRNDFDLDVTVRVALRSSDPKLVVQDEPELTVRAHTDAVAHVSVKGIGNGNVSAHVELLSPGGDPVSAAPPFDVRVRADWETVGTAVIAAVLGLALVAGIWRTVRRGRSSARTTLAEAPEAEVAGTPAAPPTGSTPATSVSSGGPPRRVPAPRKPAADAALPVRPAAPRPARTVPEPEELPSDPATPAGRTPGA